jgi:hypothetical protein
VLIRVATQVPVSIRIFCTGTGCAVKEVSPLQFETDLNMNKPLIAAVTLFAAATGAQAMPTSCKAGWDKVTSP